MTPTILVIGSTGNTGQSVVRHLPQLLEKSTTNYRIVGLTRSLDSAAAKKLAKIPHVEMLEKNWTDIDAAWLKEQSVVRAYIAPHNQPSQFADESELHLALLQAGVKYVVRVSTNTRYVFPTYPVYYGRAHWAIENLLSQPEFKDLMFTSLQPNFFTASYLSSAGDWVKKYRETKQQEVFKTNLAADVQVAMVDPEDVGTVGAHLLAMSDADLSRHNGKRYTISGPEDISSQDILALMEKYAGVKVENVEYKSTDWLKDIGFPPKAIKMIMPGFDPLWDGECTLSGTPTSKEVEEFAKPRRTIEDALKAMLEK